MSALPYPIVRYDEFASLRTARLVTEKIDAVIAAGHELDAQQVSWQAIAQRIDASPVPSPEYDALCAAEQSVTGRIVQLQRQLGREVPA